MLQYEVKMKISGILKYLFPITVNIYKMQSTVNETGCLFENRMKRAPWVIEKVQWTFLCDREEEKTTVNATGGLLKNQMNRAIGVERK